MIIKTIVAAASIGFTLTAHSAVSIDVNIGSLRDATGTELPDGSIVAIFADNGNDGFLNAQTDLINQTLVQGSLYGGDELLFLGTISTVGPTPGVVAGSTGLFDYDNGLTEGTDLILYWFDTTSTTLDPGVGEIDYGTYESDTVDTNSGGTTSLDLFADNGTYNLFYFDQSVNPTGLPTVADFTADQKILAIPEPSTLLMTLCGSLFLIGRRKRNA